MSLEFSREHKGLCERGEELKKAEKPEAFGSSLRKFGSCSGNRERGGMVLFLQNYSCYVEIGLGSGQQEAR